MNAYNQMLEKHHKGIIHSLLFVVVFFVTACTFHDVIHVQGIDGKAAFPLGNAATRIGIYSAGDHHFDGAQSARLAYSSVCDCSRHPVFDDGELHTPDGPLAGAIAGRSWA